MLPHVLRINISKKAQRWGRYEKRQPTDKQLIAFDLSDLAGVRTLDPLLKREMLYQLSYQVFYEAANIKFSFVSTSCFFLFFLSFSILLLYYILASFVV
jgi:hypothetical protein